MYVSYVRGPLGPWQGKEGFRLFASPEVRNTATYDERTERVQSDEKIEGSNTSTYD